MAYPGQGKALPSEFAYGGQWIVENRVFLFQPRPQGHLASRNSRQRLICPTEAGALDSM